MRRSTILSSAAILAVLSGGAAHAATSYVHGVNFTQDLNKGRQVMACDKQADGHEIRGDFVPAGTGSVSTVWDSDGSNNGCGYTGTYPSRVQKHRAVEVRTAAPDHVGNWVYPS